MATKFLAKKKEDATSQGCVRFTEQPIFAYHNTRASAANISLTMFCKQRRGGFPRLGPPYRTPKSQSRKSGVWKCKTMFSDARGMPPKTHTSAGLRPKLFNNSKNIDTKLFGGIIHRRQLRTLPRLTYVCERIPMVQSVSN